MALAIGMLEDATVTAHVGDLHVVISVLALG